MSLYKIDENTLIDEYGVCHKDFSLRDEVEYNFMSAKEKEMQQSLLSNSYNNFKLNKINEKSEINWNDIIMAGLTGVGEGMLAGINRGINGASFGLYGRAVNAALDNIYTNQQNRIQNRADQAGLGNFNKLANQAIDVGSQFLSGKFLKL